MTRLEFCRPTVGGSGLAPGDTDINTDQKPPRTVGLAGSILINLNSVVGSGIFALPAVLFTSAGTFAPYAILIFAVFYGCVIAVSAKLSTVFRQSGGAQLYAEHAFGRFAGFEIGLFGVAATSAGSAANFHVLASYLAAIFPFFGDPVIRLSTIAVLVVTFSGLSISGTVRSINTIAVGTVFKLAPLLGLCLVGFAQNGIPTEVVLPQFTEFESIALLLAFAFSGADFATTTAGETKNPRATVMRGIFVNLVAVAVFYAMVQLAYIAIAPDPAEVESPLAAAGAVIMGPTGALAISLAVVFSVATFQLNSFVATPRVIYGMARRGLLPNLLAYVSPRFQTPAAAIGLYGLIVGGLSLSGSFESLAVLLVSSDQLIFASSITALIVMWRRNSGGIADHMDARWAVIVPVAIAMVVWLFMQVPPSALVSVAMLMAIGAVLYLASKRSAVQHEAIDLPQRRA